MRIPTKGEVWRHNKSGGHYEILGAIFNTITDEVDVKYRPLYPGCDYDEFSRQIRNHPKAWTTPNDDGSPRFTMVGQYGKPHSIDWYKEPDRG